jgi:hypothetical protein
MNDLPLLHVYGGAQALRQLRHGTPPRFRVLPRISHIFVLSKPSDYKLGRATLAEAHEGQFSRGVLISS